MPIDLAHEMLFVVSVACAAFVASYAVSLLKGAPRDPSDGAARLARGAWVLRVAVLVLLVGQLRITLSWVPEYQLILEPFRASLPTMTRVLVEPLVQWGLCMLLGAALAGSLALKASSRAKIVALAATACLGVLALAIQAWALALPFALLSDMASGA